MEAGDGNSYGAVKARSFNDLVDTPLSGQDAASSNDKQACRDSQRCCAYLKWLVSYARVIPDASLVAAAFAGLLTVTFIIDQSEAEGQKPVIKGKDLVWFGGLFALGFVFMFANKLAFLRDEPDADQVGGAAAPAGVIVGTPPGSVSGARNPSASVVGVQGSLNASQPSPLATELLPAVSVLTGPVCSRASFITEVLVWGGLAIEVANAGLLAFIEAPRFFNIGADIPWVLLAVVLWYNDQLLFLIRAHETGTRMQSMHWLIHGAQADNRICRPLDYVLHGQREVLSVVAVMHPVANALFNIYNSFLYTDAWVNRYELDDRWQVLPYVVTAALFIPFMHLGLVINSYAIVRLKQLPVFKKGCVGKIRKVLDEKLSQTCCSTLLSYPGLNIPSLLSFSEADSNFVGIYDRFPALATLFYTIGLGVAQGSFFWGALAKMLEQLNFKPIWLEVPLDVVFFSVACLIGRHKYLEIIQVLRESQQDSSKDSIEDGLVSASQHASDVSF